MKTVRINTTLLVLNSDSSPLAIAEHIGAFLFHKTSGAVFGRWDETLNTGLWFYSQDNRAHVGDASVDEVIFSESDRNRFRSVIFRQGTLASETVTPPSV